MGSATRAIKDRVTKQIVTIFSKTCNNDHKMATSEPLYKNWISKPDTDHSMATYQPLYKNGYIIVQILATYQPLYRIECSRQMLNHYIKLGDDNVARNQSV